MIPVGLQYLLPMGLNLIWTKGLDDKSKKKFEDLFRNSQVLLNRIREVLAEERRALEANEISKNIYETPNWPYVQADINGQKKVLKKLEDLFEIKD